MSTGLEHEQCAESLGAFALGALSEEETGRIRHHLSTCRECRADLDWLRAAADALPASVPQVDPPPELKARVMQIVTAEAELLRAAGEAADRPAPTRRARRWRWPPFSFLTLRPALAVAAAGALALALVLVLTGSGATNARTIAAQVSHVAPGGQASLVIHGQEASLVVRGLTPPPAGHVDELWVKRGNAQPQPAGTFVVKSGSVQVQRPVRRGDVVLVTVEPGQGTTAPTTQPFVIAHA